MVSSFVVLNFQQVQIRPVLAQTIIYTILNLLLFSGDKPNHYGQQRLWGAVGWGLFTLVAGFLVDELSKNQLKKDYTIAFYIVMVNVLFSIVVSYQLKVSNLSITLLLCALSPMNKKPIINVI